MNELTKAGRISFWAFILHKPEDDEGGRKEHIHLYVEPSKMLQTDDLTAELIEPDPSHPEGKPRKCLTWRSSKFDDWYLYALHDKRYLSSKYESRRFHYVHDDIITSDEDDLNFKAKSIDLISLSPYADMLDAISHGLTFSDYFRRGTIPIQQVKLFETAWNMLIETSTNRSGRPNHPMDVDVDPDTGEVLKF